MSQIELELIVEPSLYAPSPPAAGEAMLFYLVPSQVREGAEPPGQLTVDDAWQGTDLGYFVFLNTYPDGSKEYVEFEIQLAEALPPVGKPPVVPAHTGLVWATWSNGSLDVPGVLRVAPDPPDAIVAATFITPPTRGIKSLGFDKDTPITTERDVGGDIQGLVLQYPPQAAVDGRPKSEPPWGNSVLVPLSGVLSGCLVFQSLINEPTDSPATAAAALKQLFDCSLDPVRPYDSSRTRYTPTGMIFVLEEDEAGAFHLRPA